MGNKPEEGRARESGETTTQHNHTDTDTEDMRTSHAASTATACAVLLALLSSSAAHSGIPTVTTIGSLGQTVFGGRRLLQANPPPAVLAPGTVGQSIIGRKLAQLLMPGPFIAGGWADVDADESFQTLVNVFNYATMVLPGLNANDMSKGGTYQLCSAKQQVVAGMNYLLSLDGQFEITDMALGEDVGSRRRNLMQT